MNHITTEGGGKKGLKTKGFTLSEVLVTLVIIGVIAAITLPVIMTNVKKKQYVVRLKKFYSEFSQALERYSIDFGNIPLIDSSSSSDEFKSNVENFVIRYFGTAPKYNSNNTLKFHFLNKKAGNNGSGCTLLCLTYGAETVIFQTNSGYTVEIDKRSRLVVDINGVDNKNTMGRDVFEFYIKNNKLVAPYGDSTQPEHMYWRTNSLYCGTSDNASVSGTIYGTGCVARIIDEGWEMKY